MSSDPQFFVELTSGQAANYDFTPDGPAGPAHADWIELPSGGTVVFIDGTGAQRTLSNAEAGKSYAIRISKIISSTQTIRVGTGDAPKPTGAVGPTGPNFTVTAVKTGDYTAAAGELVRVSTAAAHTITLPTAVGIAGQRIAVKDVTGAGANTNNITIATTSSQTVDGAAPAAITADRGARVYYSDGANWLLLA